MLEPGAASSTLAPVLENEERVGFADVRGYISEGGRMYPVALEVQV